VSLVPVPSQEDRTSCPNCSAPLAPDQRYCLSCGKPVSAVRLAFLDVLESESQPYAAAQGPVGVVAAGYPQAAEPATGAQAWLRRYSGLLALLGVLLLATIVGLLLGHWVTQTKAPTTSTVKIEGLSGAPLANSSSATPTTATPAPSAAAHSTTPPAAAITTTPKAEAKEAKEAKAIEKTPPPKPIKVTPAKLQKLSNSTGKKHEEEVNKLGAEPIETG
jgi:hypothetical protein